MAFRTTTLRDNSILSDLIRRPTAAAVAAKFFGKLATYDLILLGAVFTLVAFGLISLFSTTQPELTNFYKQFLWLVLGLAVFFTVSAFDYRFFRVHSIPALLFYAIGSLGVVGVLLFGTTIRGAKSWIDLGFFNIEPVELVKIALILILAKYFSMRHAEIYRFRHIFISGIYVAIPALLVLMQPDAGSFTILVVIWGGMVLVSGIRLRHILVLALAAFGFFSLAWQFLLLAYQKARLAAFINPAGDPLGAAYNSIQAKVAVISGGLFGKGLGQGTQTQLGFLPEAQTDFIYAALAEELGILIAVIILVLFGVIFWRLARICVSTTNNFARLSILGIAIMIMAQFTLNVSMSIGILPVTGVTLPFVSYGGSSLIALFLALGIVQSIYRFSSQTTPGHYEIS